MFQELWLVLGFTPSGGEKQVDSFKPFERRSMRPGQHKEGSCAFTGIFIYMNQPHPRHLNENYGQYILAL